jgi:hypothetical protein
MRRRHWIIWLILALLPLRGLAVATMEMPGSATDVAVAESPASASAAHGNAPCHDGADHDPDSNDHACSLCDLCHCAVIVPPEVAAPAQPLPGAIPRPGLARDTGRNAIGGLERPPRRLVA